MNFLRRISNYITTSATEAAEVLESKPVPTLAPVQFRSMSTTKSNNVPQEGTHHNPRTDPRTKMGYLRYALYPIWYPEYYKFYAQQEAFSWIAAELKFGDDIPSYNSCTPKIKRMIDYILAFFLIGDGAVIANIDERFLGEATCLEEDFFFKSQQRIETVHADTYGMAAFAFMNRDQAKMNELMRKAQDTKCIQAKMDFMIKYTKSDLPRSLRLVAFACAEGIFFCTSFAFVFWLRSRGICNNFVTANILISRDESLHRDFGCFLVKQEPEVELELVYKIIEEAVAVEDMFVDFILEEDIEDLRAKDLKQYARVLADQILYLMDMPIKYKVENPIPYVDIVALQDKANGFELQSGAYQKCPDSEMFNPELRAKVDNSFNEILKDPRSVEF